MHLDDLIGLLKQMMLFSEVVVLSAAVELLLACNGDERTMLAAMRTPITLLALGSPAYTEGVFGAGIHTIQSGA